MGLKCLMASHAALRDAEAARPNPVGCAHPMGFPPASFKRPSRTRDVSKLGCRRRSAEFIPQAHGLTTLQDVFCRLDRGNDPAE